MKNIYIFISILFISFSAVAQIVNIPDANFKNVLVHTNCVDTNNNLNGDVDVDTNNDGEIQLSEALAVSRLILEGQNLTNISGIENFTNLTYLECAGNALGQLDVTMLTHLEYLGCSNCQLTALNVDGLSNLVTLQACCNNFTVLDLSNTAVVDFIISGSTSLQYLNIKNGHITNSCVALLDGSNVCSQFSGCTALQVICVDEEELTYLNAVPNNFTNLITYCSFEPGGGYNTINGSVTFDCGGTDTLANYQNVSITGANNNGQTSSGINGQYTLYSGLGTQTISLSPETANYFSVTPANYIFNFSTTGNTQTANFCLTPNGVHPDLEVTILPIVGARPGFDAYYNIQYKNKGNQIQSGTVNLTYEDAVLDYVSSTPIIPSQTLNNLTWNFTDLHPFETRSIYIVLNVNSPQETPPVNINDVLHFQVAVNSATADETPPDNVMNYNQIVRGSFDPNDKTVIQGTSISLGQTSDYLNYIIRFQNTGTDAAENIVVKDMLSDKLDWSTLQMVSSSHPFRSTLTSGNKLEVFYSNINLPASSIDELGSHGYIAFKIKPKNTVVLNDVIQNSASIYFDFNYPMVTNIVSTTVSNLGIVSNQNDQFTIYPNPTASLVNIIVSNNQPINRATINNVVGQTLMTFENTTTLDISSLVKGTYLITVETDNGKATQKIIKL